MLVIKINFIKVLAFSLVKIMLAMSFFIRMELTMQVLVYFVDYLLLFLAQLFPTRTTDFYMLNKDSIGITSWEVLVLNVAPYQHFLDR